MLISDANDGKILLMATKMLPKLREIGVEGLPCADRLMFFPGIQSTFEGPLGFAELMSMVRVARLSRSSCIEHLDARKID